MLNLVKAIRALWPSWSSVKYGLSFAFCYIPIRLGMNEIEMFDKVGKGLIICLSIIIAMVVYITLNVLIDRNRNANHR